MNESNILMIRNGSWENRLKQLEELITRNYDKILYFNEQERHKYLSFIFDNTIDLLLQNECRKRLLKEYCKLLDGHTESIGILRYYLFNRIILTIINVIGDCNDSNDNGDQNDQDDDDDDDIPNLIDFLMVLTDHGKILSHYETEIATFIIILIEKLFENNNNNSKQSMVKKYDNTLVQQKLLEFMINLIKYNAAYVCSSTDSSSSKALIKMIRFVCGRAYRSQSLNELKLIYEFLNVVLSYSHLPTETLSQFIVIVCIGINRLELYDCCNKIMRNLIGTYLGFDAITTLHHIIEDEINFSDKLLIRGAVYFLIQSLWGQNNIINSDITTTISMISANVILPAFKILLNNDMMAKTSPLIALEIANGIQMFITTTTVGHISNGKILDNSLSKCSSQIVNQYTWHLVLDICDILVSNYLINKQLNNNQQLNKTILSILKLMEKIIISYDESFNDGDGEVDYDHVKCDSLTFLFDDDNDNFIENFFTIFEMAIDYLTNETIANLIEHRLNHINNRYRFDLEKKFKQLRTVIETHFIRSKNNFTRLKCLEKLQNFLDHSNFIDVDVFWEKVGCNFFSCNNDQNDNNKELSSTINFLIYLTKKCRSQKNLLEFIEIFEMVINNRLKIYRQYSIETTINHQNNNQNRTQQNQNTIIHQISAPNISTTNELITNNLFDDVIYSINGLITIFIKNIDHYNCHQASIQAIRSLIKVLNLIQKIHHHHHHHSHSHHYSIITDESSSSFNRTISLMKRKIFHTILSLRTNRWAQLGVVDNNNDNDNNLLCTNNMNELSPEHVIFTPYILIRDMPFNINRSATVTSPPVTPPQQHNDSSSSTTTFHLTFIEAIKLIIDAIQLEKDWSVLQLIFVELPKTLKHKGLILAAAAAAVTTSSTQSTPSSSMTHLSSANNNSDCSIPDQLVTALCKFIDRILNHFNELYLGETKLSKVDILAHIYDSISALVGYKLLSSSQNSIVKCLLNGLIHFSSKISCLRQCIVSLTICTIEWQTTMNRYLSETIMQLSKITTTKALAIPKLEFLSNIIVFPDIYYTFTNKQYLSIFMIAQSYINPYKYGEYTVALALRVIFSWFLKCPIPCRLELVHFLIKGFQNNILKDNHDPNNLAQIMTQKLSNDQQSRQSNSNRFLLVSSPPPPPSTPLTQNTFSFNNNSLMDNDKPFTSSLSSAFNMVGHQQQQQQQLLGNDSVIFDPMDKEKSKIELVEVCMDMLASNAFTTSSPLPLKPSMIDKLLNKDKTQYWMIGHKIIQITTTGCTSRAIRNGLCNKCFTICHMNRHPQTLSSSSSNSLSYLVESWNEKFNNSTNNCNNNNNNNDNNNQQHQHQQYNYLQNQQLNQALANRRRHRSEINHSTRMKYNNHHTNDDYFINQQMLRASSSSSTESDLNNNNVSKYCCCWCQTWAEILIRRATGTTRLILRVENNLGEFPNWTSSKHEDDSISKIFENISFPDINNVPDMLNSNNDNNNEISSNAAADADKSSSTNNQPSSFDSGNISSSTASDEQQQQQQKTKAKISQPVSRAASFAGSRTTVNHKINDDDRNHDCHHHHSNVVRKLEKDFSFEEDTTPPGGSQINLSSTSSSSSTVVKQKQMDDELLQQQQNYFQSPIIRDRGYTISVMTSVQKNSSSSSSSGINNHHQFNIDNNNELSSLSSSISASNVSLSSSRQQPFSPAGLSPQFVFLQLYYNSMFKDKISNPTFGTDVNFEKPIQLDLNEQLKISLNTFDSITPYETHKIGILYVGPGQTDRSEILANQIGSYRYARLLNDIGQLISLEDIDPRVFYVGGLGTNRMGGIKDGPYAISWCDHLVQCIFHVATMMPTLPNDPKCNNKMAHIGNDLVCIVYNNSGEQNFDLFSLKSGIGQLMLAVVMITPLEYDSNIVEIKSRKEFAQFMGYTKSEVLSDDALPVYVRQLAIHANLAAMVGNPKQELRSYHISNWLSRLRNIKRVRKRIHEQQQQHHHHHHHHHHHQHQHQQNHHHHYHHHHHHHNFDNNHEQRYSIPNRNVTTTSGTRMARQNDDSITTITSTSSTTSSAISPNIHSGGNSSSSNVSFDYDQLLQQQQQQQRFQQAFPDFTEFTKD